MKILLIGPGEIPIPSFGHGAVENLIYSYYLHLQSLGYKVDFTNTKSFDEIIEKSIDFDLCHIHYDVFYGLAPRLKSEKVVISSHYPYIEQIQRHQYDDYHKIFRFMIEHSDYYPIFAISEKDRKAFINWGCPPQNVYLMQNGINVDEFYFTSNPSQKHQTICLGRISDRKRQYLTQNINRVWYAGRGEMNHPNYLGEPPTIWKHEILTHFANMILLSQGENGSPLVLLEGMAAGLGIVCSEGAAHELDRAKPWITVLSESEAQNPKIISDTLEKNAEIALNHRDEIRAYARTRDWSRLIPKYVENLHKVLERK